MPTYCYKREDNGDRFELTMTIREMSERQDDRQRIKLPSGVWATRDYISEDSRRPPPGNWPMASDAAGVHPDQRKEAQDHSKTIGIPTEFTADGAAVFRSPSHRKRYCEAIGLFDRNAGPSDPVPMRR